MPITAPPLSISISPWATQTSLSVDDAAEAVQAIKQRFRGAVGPRAGDVCYASRNRQAAVKALAGLCDVLIVVGSAQSHNTATGNGGAIFNLTQYGGMLVAIGASFATNNAAAGGAIFNTADATASGCHFSRNQSPGTGA